MSIIPVTVPPKKLAQTISSTATSFKLNNIKSWSGADLTPADFGTEAYGVFMDSTKTVIEIFKFDPATIASASITILARGLPYNGGTTPVPANQYAWASNDTTVQLGTDAPQLFRDFLSQVNTATVTAVHTYNVLPETAVAPTTANQFVNKNYVDNKTGPAVSNPVNQVAHGFVVGDVIRVSGINTYTKAQADSTTNAEVVGIVSVVTDADNFTYITEGVMTVGVPAQAAGTVLFLSPTTAGALTATEPTTIGQISMPLAVVTQSAARMVFHKYRGAQLNTIAGNPVASETVAGVVEEATTAQVASKTDVGETGAKLFVPPSKLPVSTVFTAATQKVLDGSPVPLAVHMLTDGYLYPTNPATVPAGGSMFHGFLTQDSGIAAADEFKYLNGAQSTSESYNATANAGNKRVMLIIARTYGTNSTYTGVTVNGVPATQIGTQQNSLGAYNIRSTYWIAYLGNSLSGDTPAVVLTGRSGGFGGHTVMVFQGVNQTTGFADQTFALEGTASNTKSKTQTLTPAHTALVYAMLWGGNPGSISTSTGHALNTIDTTAVSGAYCAIGYVTPYYAGASTLTITGNSGLNIDSSVFATFRLIPDVTASSALSVQFGGELSGFVGLTPGANYYAIANGAISTTPVSDSPFVGVALSSTKLLVQREPNTGIGIADVPGGGSVRVSLGFRPSFIRAYGGGNDASYGGSFGFWRNGKYAGVRGDDSGSVLFTTYTDSLIKRRTYQVTVTSVDATGFTLQSSGVANMAIAYEAVE